MKTKVNLGCDFYCNALVPDTTMVTMDVGLNFMVEMKIPEAIEFCGKKSDHLLAKAKRSDDQAAEVKSTIKMVLAAMAELMGLMPEEGKKGKGVLRETNEFDARGW